MTDEGYIDPRESADPKSRDTRSREELVRDGRTAFSVRRVAAAVTVAFLINAFLNSDGLLSFVRDLPAGPAEPALTSVAGGWHDLMEITGFAAPKAALRTGTEALQHVDWDDFGKNAKERGWRTPGPRPETQGEVVRMQIVVLKGTVE